MKKQNGITVIALIITIIILLILASVAISTIRNEGIIEHAQIQQNKVQNKFDNLNSLLQEQNHYLNNVATHDHVLDDGVVKVQPTCTETGTIKYSCTISGCTYTRTNSIDALGHSYIENRQHTYIKIGAKCTTKAVYYMSCERCGVKGTETFTSGTALGHDLEPNGMYTWYNETKHIMLEDCKRCTARNIQTELENHSFTNYTSNNDETCTENGTKTAQCDKCTATKTITNTGSALGHDLELNGKYAYENKIYHYILYDCKRCSVKDIKNGHYYHSMTKTTQTAATCTTKGTSKYTCACGYSYTAQDIPATGHTSINGGTKEVHTKCSTCGVTLSSEHSYTETIQTAATCTTKGTTKYTCACGYSYTAQDIATTAHSYKLKTVRYPADDATCTTPATFYYACEDCRAKGTETFTSSGSELGHNLDGGTVYPTPTCTTTGTLTYKCTRAGCNYKETTILEALGHTGTKNVLYRNNSDDMCEKYEKWSCCGTEKILWQGYHDGVTIVELFGAQCFNCDCWKSDTNGFYWD